MIIGFMVIFQVHVHGGDGAHARDRYLEGRWAPSQSYIFASDFAGRRWCWPWPGIALGIGISYPREGTAHPSLSTSCPSKLTGGWVFRAAPDCLGRGANWARSTPAIKAARKDPIDALALRIVLTCERSPFGFPKTPFCGKRCRWPPRKTSGRESAVTEIFEGPGSAY